MYEELTKLVFDYTIKNKLADDNFINSVIEIIISHRKLEGYIKSIRIATIPNIFTLKKAGSGYRPSTRGLQIYKADLFRLFHSNLMALCHQNRSVLLYNLTMILMLLHELDHAALEKSMDCKDGDLTAVLTEIIFDDFYREVMDANLTGDKEKMQKFYSDTEKSGKIYDYAIVIINFMRFHDADPSERRANFVGHMGVSSVLQNLCDTSIQTGNLKYASEVFLKKFIKQCLFKYKVIGDFTNSPTIDLYCKVNRPQIKDLEVYDADIQKFYEKASSAYSLQERLIHGFPLTKDEYESINMTSNPFCAYQL